jgi:hypothetical protein
MRWGAPPATDREKVADRAPLPDRSSESTSMFVSPPPSADKKSSRTIIRVVSGSMAKRPASKAR